LPTASFASVVLAFGAEAKAKLDNPVISGAPEDQLRTPLESLLHSLAALDNLAPGDLSLVGETALSQMQTRPDLCRHREQRAYRLHRCQGAGFSWRSTTVPP
jgi:hypothetical protein